MLALPLAIAADFDYLPAWCCGLQMTPRYSHSIGFSCGIGLLAWWLVQRQADWRNDTTLFSLCLAAPLSHLLLDLLVGVQAKPVLWPLFAEPLALPFGILPSAGALYWRNTLLWRKSADRTGNLAARSHAAAFCPAAAAAAQGPRAVPYCWLRFCLLGVAAATPIGGVVRGSLRTRVVANNVFHQPRGIRIAPAQHPYFTECERRSAGGDTHAAAEAQPSLTDASFAR